jgi:hypothetical protein
MGKITPVVLVSLVAGFSCANPVSSVTGDRDIRECLLESARRGDPKFPDGNEVILTHFSYIGKIESAKGSIYIVDERAVISGMLSPRGLNHIAFVSDDLKFLGKIRYVQSRPLWCEGSKVYLFGDLDGGQGDGNVIDLKDGYSNVRFLREKAYGSST